ncbi:unnamed protein product [Phaedon cochleariae]|uniref:Cathepsin propeptide inhibitor domain-containing protein n=1 Tax=Phaedon cochleariae TaxID=80249 RepID=A0A9P0DFM7_PHACE|nr:unnamed protein product [Phaedon cochleariae]
MFVKFLIVLMASVVVLAANLSDEDEWKNFKLTHQKSYDTPEEEARRLEIFTKNLRAIRAHNEKFARGETSYTQGINQFADLTEEEFRQGHLGLRQPTHGSK